MTVLRTVILFRESGPRNRNGPFRNKELLGTGTTVAKAAQFALICRKREYRKKPGLSLPRIAHQRGGARSSEARISAAALS
jgi:hypothetical protein